MEQKLINIGNSKGIKLEKSILEKYDIKDKIDLIMEKGQIVIRPREGWDKEFRGMHENGDDRLLMPDVFEDEKFE